MPSESQAIPHWVPVLAVASTFLVWLLLGLIDGRRPK